MASSSYKTYLMHKGSGGTDYAKLVDIKDFPDLGGEPEMLETTTLSDAIHTYVMGIQSLDALTFTCNYDKTKFTELKALEGVAENYAVYFDEDGSDGMFTFTGQLSVYAAGKGVNEVREMIVSIAPNTPITFA